MTSPSDTDILKDEIQTGLFSAIPEREYHSMRHPSGMWIPSSSTLKRLKVSPKACKWTLDNPGLGSTAVMEFGSAFHCRLLEHERYEKDYEVFNGARMTQANIADAADRGKLLIRARDLVHQTCMLGALDKNSAAKHIMEKVEDREVTVIWNDPGSDVLCRGRPDALVPEWETVVDIKTSKSATRESFQRTLADFQHHISAAMYIDGLRWNNYEYSSFIFIVIQREPPYEVAVFELDPEDLDRGRRQYKALLAEWKLCMETNHWPDRVEGVQVIGLPSWVRRQLDGEESWK